MDEAELKKQIAELEAVANTLTGIDQTLKLNQLDTLRIKLAPMALNKINALLQTMSPPDIADMKAKIASAKDAMKAQQERVQLFNQALGMITKGLGIVL